MDDRSGVIAQGEFPSKKDNWPRLLYHRYFMLADQCEVAAATDAEANQWQRLISRRTPANSCASINGASVRVQRIVTHYPLRLPDALRGKPLDYPETYRTEMEVVQRRQDLDLPPPNQLPNQSGMYNSNWRQDVASGWQGGTR